MSIRIIFFCFLIISCNSSSDKTIINSEQINNIDSNSQIKFNPICKSYLAIDSGIKFIKEFYLICYIKNKDLIEIDKSGYISETILMKIDSLQSNPDNLELDYDPFIQGQDYDNESIEKSIEIKYNEIANTFLVSFLLFPDSEKVKIEYELVKDTKGKLKISNILSDVNLSIN